MGQKKLSEEKLRQIQDLAAEWGKIVARRALEGNPSAAGLDLQDMEQIAFAATSGLTEGTFEALLHSQSQSLGAQQLCPKCGLLRPVRTNDRFLFVKRGKINFHEPVCHCPTCRRDFFPPQDSSAFG